MAYPPVNPDDGQSKFAIFNVDPLRVTPPDVNVDDAVDASCQVVYADAVKVGLLLIVTGYDTCILAPPDE